MIAPEHALGLVETHGFTPAMAAIDAMEKGAGVSVLQVEINDMLGVCVKVVGPVANVKAALAAAKSTAEAMQGRPVVHMINRPDPRAVKAIESPKEISPLIQQDVVFLPRAANESAREEKAMSEASFALGLIETQGFTAVFEAVDSACKAANVEVVAKEKLGGGYITVVLRGDVAAVKAAIDTARSRVEGLGKLIAAHVIPRPSASVLSLLPKM